MVYIRLPGEIYGDVRFRDGILLKLTFCMGYNYTKSEFLCYSKMQHLRRLFSSILARGEEKMKEVFISLVLTMVVVFLAACSPQDAEGGKELIVNHIYNVEDSEEKEHKTNDQVNEKEYENQRESLMDSFLSENLEYKKENIESIRALVLDIVPSQNERQLSVKIRDYDTQEILTLRDEKEKLSALKKGQNIVVVTTKLWKQSSPPQNSPLKLIVL